MDEVKKKFFWNKQFNLKGRVVYPNLFTPKDTMGTGKAKFNTAFMWPKEENKEAFSEMVGLIKEYKTKYFPTHPNFIIPFKDENARKQDGRPILIFSTVIIGLMLLRTPTFRLRS